MFVKEMQGDNMKVTEVVGKFVMGEWMVEQKGRVVWEQGMIIEFLIARALI